MNLKYKSKNIKFQKIPKLHIASMILNSDPSEDDQSDEDFEEGLVKVGAIQTRKKYVSP